MRYFIKENYYFDIDHHNQLRVTGPENHLFFGATFPLNINLEIVSFKIHAGNLVISIKIPSKEISMSSPIVCDIRTLRNYVENTIPRPTYGYLLEKDIKDLSPKKLEILDKKGWKRIQFLNEYTDDLEQRKIYGSEILISSKYQINFEGSMIHIKGSKDIEFKISTITNIHPFKKQFKNFFKHSGELPNKYFSEPLRNLYAECQQQISHLIKSNKTSSFEYGTIFPRDWTESADLGESDLTQKVVDYMYAQSMAFISESGEAWHENVVGEYKTKVKNIDEHIDRKMIDIEPHYIMGLEKVSKQFLTTEENHEKFKRVANYILKNAEEKDLITFKKIPESEEYRPLGNWRDSYYAFPRQKSPLAPYDVNCVFYPLSLRIIRKYSDYFEITDTTQLDKLVQKWDDQKSKFRLYHPGGIIGYSLALHGKKNIPLSISHLDESYDLFYGSPSLEEIVSFAHKLIDPEYFYTPVGPILVASDEEDFSTKQYHGKVIWPKQAAYAVAGLYKQYKRGLREGWPQPVRFIIKDAIIKTAEACFKGWTDLQSIPELYYYDSKTNKARFYTDQEDYEAQMSLIQLWSSIGARRIIKDYISLVESS